MLIETKLHVKRHLDFLIYW